MAQGNNLSSWAGTTVPDAPTFRHEVGVERERLVERLVVKAFCREGDCLTYDLLTVSGLRDYESGEDTALFREDGNLQGIYHVGLSQDLDIVTPREILVHVKPASDENTIAFGAQTFDHLRANGVNTVRHFKTKSGACQAEYGHAVACFTMFEKGIHPYADPKVLEAFGEQIAKMEDGFSCLPTDRKSMIRDASPDRYALWTQGFENWTKYAKQMGKISTAAKDVLRQCGEYLESHSDILDMDNGAPSHFELTETNTLWAEDGRAIVLDADMLLSGWSPKHYDLGTFALRVGLNQPITVSGAELPDLGKEALSPLLSGYNVAKSQRFAEGFKDGLDADQLADKTMMAGALLMMVVPALLERETELKDLSGHIQKVAPKVARAIEHRAAFTR